MNAASEVPTLRGPAFPIAVRLLASALVASLMHWGIRSLDELASVRWNGWTGVVVIGAMVLVVWSLVWMWRSRTGVDAEGIHQSWIRDKRVAWRDITQARLIAIPYLDGLITPRLVVRPRCGGVVVFHSADPRVLGAFAAYVTTGVPPLSAATP
jgi:hypothetical protein